MHDYCLTKLVTTVGKDSDTDSEFIVNCSFSAVYSFGDSLTDNGNAIAALPEQFIDSEENLNGVNFPHHAARGSVL